MILAPNIKNATRVFQWGVDPTAYAMYLIENVGDILKIHSDLALANRFNDALRTEWRDLASYALGYRTVLIFRGHGSTNEPTLVVRLKNTRRYAATADCIVIDDNTDQAIQDARQVAADHGAWPILELGKRWFNLADTLEDVQDIIDFNQIDLASDALQVVLIRAAAQTVRDRLHPYNALDLYDQFWMSRNHFWLHPVRGGSAHGSWRIACRDIYSHIPESARNPQIVEMLDIEDAQHRERDQLYYEATMRALRHLPPMQLYGKPLAPRQWQRSVFIHILEKFYRDSGNPRVLMYPTAIEDYAEMF